MLGECASRQSLFLEAGETDNKPLFVSGGGGVAGSFVPPAGVCWRRRSRIVCARRRNFTLR